VPRLGLDRHENQRQTSCINFCGTTLGVTAHAQRGTQRIGLGVNRCQHLPRSQDELQVTAPYTSQVTSMVLSPRSAFYNVCRATMQIISTPLVAWKQRGENTKRDRRHERCSNRSRDVCGTSRKKWRAGAYNLTKCSGGRVTGKGRRKEGRERKD
jgi:hypothetical protein